ncbi:MAG TPA: NAD(P)H-dependent oxidoreductase [Bacillota bacterium]|nr:NAD(P)H-dependent oxidoreductase [Bacillota bacterium]
MLKLQVVIGSTREGRNADRVAPWVARRAKAHGAFDVEVLDLRDWPLPMFAETRQTLGDPADPTYSDPIVRRWNRKVAEGDAFLFITPEYNHSVPGVLKNAIDSVFASYAFRNKPAGFVGYSGGIVAAARAVEHLAHIVIEAEAVPLRNSVLIGQVGQAFTEAGDPTNPMSERAMTLLLDDMAWWAALLQRGRAEGQLPPAAQRR